MSLVRGSEDLKPRRVIDGRILVESTNGKPVPMDLYMSPMGHLFAEPVAPAPIDQLGSKEATPAARRHGSVDQI